MISRLHILIVCLAGALLVGCDEQGTPAEPDSGADQPSDAGSSSGDAGEMLEPDAGDELVDAGPPPTPDAGPDPDVVQCHTLAESIATACGGQEERTCEWTELAALCDSEDAPALNVAMQCILDASSGGSCRTFSDPSGAFDCLGEMLESEVSDGERDLAESMVALCATDADRFLYRWTPPLAVLAESTTDTLSDCVALASDCAAAEACFEPLLTEAIACYE